MTGMPLPQCGSSVERAYDAYTEAFECVSPGYFSNALCSANVAMNCRSSPMPKPQLPVMT